MDTIGFAARLRQNVVRMTSVGKSSHVGSCLSCIDILAVLYAKVMTIDPKKPTWEERDRFILSKGHAGAAVYAALAEANFFPKEWLMTHYQDGSNLSGHVSHKGIPGVELSTGSLGHGLPVGAGMAYSAKLGQQKHNVYVLLSDGEFDEGSNWEAIHFAGHHKLNKLIAIIDYNKLQSLASTEETLGLEPFKAKFIAFRWNVIEVDGHDHASLIKAFTKAQQVSDAPTCIIANTVKGKGVSFMENKVLWHYRSPQGDEYEKAMRELEEHQA